MLDLHYDDILCAACHNLCTTHTGTIQAYSFTEFDSIFGFFVYLKPHSDLSVGADHHHYTSNTAYCTHILIYN